MNNPYAGAMAGAAGGKGANPYATNGNGGVTVNPDGSLSHAGVGGVPPPGSNPNQMHHLSTISSNSRGGAGGAQNLSNSVLNAFMDK